jgi:hypothetical protein
MTTRLNTFKSVWGNIGHAPTNRFHFLMSPPPDMFKALDFSGNPKGLGGIIGNAIGTVGSIIASTAASELLSFACKKCEVPSSAFNVVNINVNGLIKNRASSRDYDPIQVEFYVDSQHLVRQFFLTWHNLIMNTFNKQRSYPKDYMSAQSSLVIYDQANKSLSPTQDIMFANMWPSEIGAVTLDWESEGEHFILPVTFQYDHYYNAYQNDFFKSFVSRGIRSVVNSPPGAGLLGGF